MIFLIFLYALLGGLVLSIYGLINNSPMPYSKDASLEESHQLILIAAFWPIYLLYLFIKYTIKFFRHLFDAIKWFLKESIKYVFKGRKK